MKKTFYFIAILFSALMASCGNEESTFAGHEGSSTRSIEDYMWLGKIHNDFLDSACDILANEATRSLDPDIDWDYLNKCQIAQAQALDINEAYKTILVSGIAEYKRFYDSDILFAEAFPNDNISDIMVQYNNLVKSGIIDRFEYQLIYELASTSYKNMTGHLSNEDYTSTVFSLCDEWDAQYGNSLIKGDLSGYLLAISKSSMEWWDDQDLTTRSASVIIAHDVIGAVISAGVSAGLQYINEKKIDAKSTAYAALTGAITGSTGVVGKISKFFGF